MFKVVADPTCCFEGKTLLMPAVSIGNSGTLAIDLVLNSNSYVKKGWIYTTDFLPFVGSNALDNQDSPLTFPLEIFEVSDVVVLQIRSLCADKDDFVEKLLDWATEKKIAKIVIVGSNLDEMKVNENEPEVFYLKNSLDNSQFSFDFKNFSEYKEFFSGVGLMKSFLKQDKIPAAGILVFSKEIPADVESGFKLGETLLSVFNFQGPLRPPKSWQGIL